jgi:hypothetical protein
MVIARTALGGMLLLAAATSSPATPDAPAPSCAATDAALPPHLAGWAKKTSIAAAADKAGLAKVRINPGSGYTLALRPTAALVYAAMPGKPGPQPSYGGMASVTIAEPGTFIAALGAGAWVDVVKDGKPLVSTGHGHGPDCSTIRKVVEFPLERGSYIVQIAGNPTTTIDLMLTRKP